MLFQKQARLFASGNSLWGKIDAAPPDPILGLNDAFKKDTDPKKVLLGMGAYRDDNNKPLILGCVKKAEEKIFEEGGYTALWKYKIARMMNSCGCM